MRREKREAETEQAQLPLWRGQVSARIRVKPAKDIIEEKVL